MLTIITEITVLEFIHSATVCHVSVDETLNSIISVDTNGMMAVWPLKKDSKEDYFKDNLCVNSLPSQPFFFRAGPEPTEYHITGAQSTHYKPKQDFVLPCQGFAISPNNRVIASLNVATPEMCFGYRRLQATGGTVSELFLAPTPVGVISASDDGTKIGAIENTNDSTSISSLLTSDNISPMAAVILHFLRNQKSAFLDFSEVTFSLGQDFLPMLPLKDQIIDEKNDVKDGDGDVVMAITNGDTISSNNNIPSRKNTPSQPKHTSFRPFLPASEWELIENEESVTPLLKHQIQNAVFTYLEKKGFVENSELNLRSSNNSATNSRRPPWLDEFYKLLRMQNSTVPKIQNSPDCPECAYDADFIEDDSFTVPKLTLDPLGASFICPNNHSFPACQVTGAAIFEQSYWKCGNCKRSFLLENEEEDASLRKLLFKRCVFCLGRAKVCWRLVT